MAPVEQVLVDDDPTGSGLPPGSARPARSPVRFTSNIVGPLFFVADLLCFIVAVPVSLLLYDLLVGERLAEPVHAFALAAFIATFFLLRSSKGAFTRSLINLSGEEGDAVFDAVISSLVASALVWQFGLIEDYSRGFSILFLVSMIAALSLSRPILRWVLGRLAARGSLEQRIALYGVHGPSISTIKELLASLQLPHLRFVGVADDRPNQVPPTDFLWIGGFAELVEMARSGEVDQVLITVPDLSKERLKEVMDGLSAVSVDVSLIPPQAIEFAPDYRVNLLGTIPVLTMWQRPFRDINQIVKRGEDLLLGGAAMIFFAPLMLVCALLVRFTSPGPILFIQPRVGFNNEVIRVLKFRTMYVERSDPAGEVTTSREDPRITPIGRFLRKCSLDELPQLINVVRGDMSLVGPRPHAIQMKVGDRFYKDAVGGYAARHRVKPGITGLAQVRGLRGEIRTVERARRRVELDKQYIDRWSIWLDFWILLATARAVLFDNDAY